jgi:hypothetical protein
MSRFRTVQTDFEELFATTAWTDNNIAAYPANYSGGYANEFCIVETVPGKVTTRRNRSFANTNTVSGQYIVQVYVPVGNGLARAMEIADILDSILNSTRLTSGTQTGIPVVDIVGTDTDDKSLFRVDFIVNFTKF